MLDKNQRHLTKDPFLSVLLLLDCCFTHPPKKKQEQTLFKDLTNAVSTTTRRTTRTTSYKTRLSQVSEIDKPHTAAADLGPHVVKGG